MEKRYYFFYLLINLRENATAKIKMKNPRYETKR